MCDRQPTDSGLRRYPASAGFYRNAVDAVPFPCECEAACDVLCDGHCGCFACALSTFDRVVAEAASGAAVHCAPVRSASPARIDGAHRTEPQRLAA